MRNYRCMCFSCVVRHQSVEFMKNKPSTRIEVSHVSYVVIFTAVLYILCNVLNVNDVAKWFQLDGSIDYFSVAAFYLIGLCLFQIVFIFLAHPWTIKPLSLALVVLSASASYFINKYNIAIDRTMVMNTLYTDSREVRGLLSVQMIPYALALIALPLIVLSRIKITFRPSGRYLFGSLKLLSIALIVAVSFLYLSFDSLHRAGNMSRKHILHTLVPVNIIRSSFSAASHSLEPFLSKNKKAVEFSAQLSSQKDLVVILVIGETSRQKNFSLYGYNEKNTNPVLSQHTDLHLLNGIARLGSTLYALPEILEKDSVKLPAITASVGVDTACYVNYTLYDNCDAVGEVKASNCKYGDNCFDEDVIPLMVENLQTYTSGSRFIVLHLGGGSHGPSYNDRYPAEFQIFKPMCNDADVVNRCSVEELYNSYDNTILYVDYVLGEIIEALDRSDAPYVFIYLSDHGESLLEEGRIFHGMPPAIALPPEQAQIPLIIKSSIPIAIKQRDEYLQQDVYSTVLNLLSIQTNILDKERSFIELK